MCDRGMCMWRRELCPLSMPESPGSNPAKNTSWIYINHVEFRFRETQMIAFKTRLHCQLYLLITF